MKAAFEAAIEDVELLSVLTYEYRIAETRPTSLDRLNRTGAFVRKAPVVGAVIAAQGHDVDFALLCRKGGRVGDDDAGHLFAFPGGPLERAVHELVFRVTVEEVE